MQSSTVVVLRTLVMLAALIIVPAAAMFGSSLWPRLVRAAATLTEELEEETPEGDTLRPDPAATPAAATAHSHEHHSHDHQPHDHQSHGHQAMPVQPAYPTPPGMAAAFPTTPASSNGPSAEQPTSAPVGASPPSAMLNSMPPSGSPPPPAYPTTDTHDAVAASAPVTDPRARLASPPFWSSDTPPSHVATLQHQEPLAGHAEQAPHGGSQASHAAPIEQQQSPPQQQHPVPEHAQNGAPQAPADPERTAIEQRLQQIGALHYRLETAGTQGELFRFQCKMGLERNPNYVSYFESTAGDPVTAMRQVLQQVEGWQAGAQRR